MRLPKKLVASTAVALLALGLAACEVDQEALEDIEDPGIEEGGAGDDL